MKARNFLIIIGIIIGLCTFAEAQERVSAEFISKYLPPKSQEGVQYNDGIKEIQLKDNVLYVIDEYLGLQILDVSDVNNPREIGTVYSTHLSQNIFLTDSLAFMACRLDGVWIIDITNPAKAKKIAHVRPLAESYWVVVRKPYMFVAEADSGVMIYDISNIEQIKRISRVDVGGFTWGLAVRDNFLYVLDKRKGMLVYDISNPQAPQFTGTVLEPLKFARSIQFEGDWGFTANGPAGLFILDMKSPQRPRVVKAMSLKGYAHSATKSGNTIFVGNESTNQLLFIDVKDIANPTLEGDYKAKSRVYSAVKKDIYVYVAADSATLILRYNRPPQLSPLQDYTIDENQLLTFNASAFDPDGDPIYFTMENLPEGAVLDSLSGAFSWTPTYEQSGDYYPLIVTVHERTESHLTDSDTIRIVVNHVNRPPTLADIPDYEVDENQVLTFTIPEGEDPDREDAGKLTYRADNLPEGATFDPKTRTFTWKPTYEQSGVYTVDFAVFDPAGASMRDASTITVHHVNRKPVLDPVPAQIVAEGQRLTFTLHGSDPDREDQNALSYAAYNLPEGASFDPASATFTWTPTYEQSGEYRGLLFVFTAGAMSDSITVDITVNHVNRPPVIASIPAQTVDENKVLRFTVSGQDPDREDAGKLKFSAENLPSGAVFNADSLVFRWKPTYEQSGVYDNVRFIVSDPSGLTDTARVTITVNHVNRPPMLAAIPPKEGDENQLLSFTLQGSDPDKEDAGKLTYSADKLPEGAKLEGAEFSWTPTFDQSGTYTITFTVSDGRLSDSKQTTLTIHHVNRPPVMASTPAQTVDENQLLKFTVSGSDPDKEDAGKLTLSAFNLPEGATFDAATGTFSWTPTYEQSGEYQVGFVITDPSGLSDTLTVPVTVNHVNRTPVFAEQPPQTVDENQPLEVKLIPATDPDKEDAGKLQYSAANLPQGATFDPATLTLTWTPTFDQSGTYTVEFSVTDGEFTVTRPLQITVNNVNRPPVLAPLADQTIDENTPWSLTVSASDPDKEDAGKLRFSAKNLPQGMVFDSTKATFSWTPTYEQSGEYRDITVTVKDVGGLSDQKSFTIIVNHVNRPPVLEPVALVKGVENTPLTIQLKASDPDKEDAGKLVFSCANLPKGATLDPATGAFSWTPDFLQAGVYNLQFKVTDSGKLSAEQTVTVTIEDFNRPPTLQAIADKQVRENQNLTFKVIGSDEDTDNTLTYTAEGLPQGASFDPQTQTFSWTPTFEQAGDYSVTFTVSDGKEKAKTTAKITVINVNRAPQFEGLSDQTVKEDQMLTFQVKASDPDGTPVQLSVEKAPDGASFDPSGGTFSWKPTFEQAGNYTVVFIASDGDTSVQKQVKIQVENVNRPPEFQPVEKQSVKEDETLRFTVQATDADQGTSLTYSLENPPKGAKFDGDSHSFEWKPGFDQAGSYVLRFKVSDGEAEAVLEVPVTVENVNRPPKIDSPGDREVKAGETVEMRFKGSDPDNDDLTYSASGLPDGASFDQGSGELRWTPSDNQTGTFTITVTVSDGQESASASATIKVQPKPQPAPADTTGQ